MADLAALWPLVGVKVISAAAVAAVAACAILSVVQVRWYWADSVTLWQHDRGGYRTEFHRVQLARDCLQAARVNFPKPRSASESRSRLNPALRALARQSRQCTGSLKGGWTKPSSNIRSFFASSPTDVKAHERIGETLASARESPRKPKSYFRRAIQRTPDQPDGLPRIWPWTSSSRARPRRPSREFRECWACSRTTPRCWLASPGWRATHPAAKFRDGPAAVELAGVPSRCPRPSRQWYFEDAGGRLRRGRPHGRREDDASAGDPLAEKSHDQVLVDSTKELLAQFSSGRPYRDADLTNGPPKGKD